MRVAIAGYRPRKAEPDRESGNLPGFRAVSGDLRCEAAGTAFKCVDRSGYLALDTLAAAHYAAKKWGWIE